MMPRIPGMPDFEALERGAADAVSTVQQIRDELQIANGLAAWNLLRMTADLTDEEMDALTKLVTRAMSIVSPTDPNAAGDHFAYPTPGDSDYEESLQREVGPHETIVTRPAWDR